MAIESGVNEPPIRHDGLIEVNIAVAARTDDKGTPQIGIVIRDEEGEPFAVHVMGLAHARDLAERMLLLVEKLTSLDQASVS
jgi:hypothetical protein